MSRLASCYDFLMKRAIGVMGSSSVSDPEILTKASTIGRLIAGRDAILITGATTGAPFAAAQGTKQAGGQVIGFSPAANLSEHRSRGLPLSDHDFIIYTGFGSAARNILNVRASDALIFIAGSMGALNEFTIAYDEEKVIGILENTGGFCDQMDWLKHLSKPTRRADIHCDPDPSELLRKVFDSLPPIY